jgi:C-terminal processing protease CtpA/Prc
MIAGIGPLLGEGIYGYFLAADEKVPFSYKNGASLQGRYVRCRVRNNGYKTKKDRKWIIVLTGPKTSSSGEIVTLAFKGRDQVFQYGEPTAGFTTANATYTLSDKSMLVLTVSTEADHTGKVYEGKIHPDELIPSSTDNKLDDAAKAAAIMWLHIQ